MKKTSSHSSRKKILLILGALLMVGSACANNYSSSESSDAQRIKTDAIMAVRGQLMPFNMDMSKDFTVDLGTSKFTTSSQALAQGFDPLGALDLGHSWPFVVGFKDNKMSVSANITNSNNQIVGYIEDNEWKSVSPTSMQIWDRNYNDYAFEILDTNKIPIFNVRVVGPNGIQIAGLLNAGSGTRVLISDEGGGIISNPTQQDITDTLVPIFKYPSNDHLGQLINPTYLSSLPTDTSNKMFADAAFWMNSSYVFLFMGVLITTGLGVNFAHTLIQKKKLNLNSHRTILLRCTLVALQDGELKGTDEKVVLNDDQSTRDLIIPQRSV